MPSLDVCDAPRMDADLRRRHPQLPEPVVLPWTEQPVIALDRETP